MARKLPIGLQVKWREKAQQIRYRGASPQLHDLVDFIERVADAASDPVFEKIGECQRPKGENPKGKNGNVKGPSKTATFSTQVATPTQTKSPSTSQITNTGNSSFRPSTKLKCFDCGNGHRIIDCDGFKAKSLKERNAVVRSNKLCFNCLYKGYFSSDCKQSSRCDSCPGKHHRLLHKYTLTPNENQGSVSVGDKNNTARTVVNVAGISLKILVGRDK
jgi:hypothetical protein